MHETGIGRALLRFQKARRLADDISEITVRSRDAARRDAANARMRNPAE